jgi:hypothetical protein
VYVAARDSSNVFQIVPDGVVRVVFEGGLGDQPEHLALGPDDQLYLATGGHIYRIDLPECEDGRDNDRDGWYDGNDPDCRRIGRERPPSCGLGPELVLAIAGLLVLRERRRF